MSERPRCVFLVHETPWPPDSGLKHRLLQTLQAACSIADTTVISFAGELLSEDARAQIIQSVPGLTTVIEVQHSVRIRQKYSKLVPCLARSLIRHQPYSIEKFRSPEMKNTCRQLAIDQDVDFIIATMQMVSYLDEFGSKIPIVLDCQNLEHELWSSVLPVVSPIERLFVTREATRLKQYERKAWNQATGTIAICDEDADVMRKHVASSSPIHVSPPYLPMRENDGPVATPPHWNGGAIGMIAQWTWAPNKVAMDEFLNKLLPTIRKSSKQPIVVAGLGLPPITCQRLNDFGVTLLGYVPHPSEFYQQVDVICAPYKVGGGVRIKVLEAMLYGKPVVGYPLSFRGLVDEASRGGICCQDAEEMCRELLHISSNREIAIAQGKRGRESARHAHSKQRGIDETANYLQTFLGPVLDSDRQKYCEMPSQRGPRF